MPVTPFRATVTNISGDFDGVEVVLLLERGAVVYPSGGDHVTVFPADDGEGNDSALARLADDAERWAKVQALLGPDVLEDIAAGRIVRQDTALASDTAPAGNDSELAQRLRSAARDRYANYGHKDGVRGLLIAAADRLEDDRSQPADAEAPRPVIGWITPEDMRRVRAAPAEGHSRWVPIRTHRDDSYTVPLQAAPPPAPRTVRVPWAKALEQQLTVAAEDWAPAIDVRREVHSAEVSLGDGQITLYNRDRVALVDVDADGMVEVLDDGAGGVVVPPTQENPDDRPS